MKKTVATILCILTLCGFLLLFVQQQTHFIKTKPLNGVYYESNLKVLSLNNLRDGSYQKHLEEYLRYKFGFREIFIRTYNQYIWDFYHKKLNYTIYVGKDDWLFGRDEVINFYQSRLYAYANSRAEMKRQFDKEAMRLYKVQHILGEYGTFIFVTMLPGKSLIYPEYMPENPGLTLEPFHAYQYYPHVFDSLGINYINVLQIFQDWKGKTDYPLYPKTGKHWTYIASAHAFDTIERYIESEGNMNLKNYTVGPKYQDKTEYPDNDLEGILNLWRPIRPNQNYYAKTTLDHDSTVIYPTFINIGDSYFWNLTKSAPLWGIFLNVYYWYYNSTIYYDANHDHTSKVDILSEILNAKVISLSYSPEQLYVFSNGFLPKALLYLTHDDAEIDGMVTAIADTISQGNDLERIEGAKKALFAEPEKYFPDLASDAIPVTRNSRIPQPVSQNRK